MRGRKVRERRDARLRILACCTLALAMAIAFIPPATAGDTVSITSLIEDMKKYDGQRVTIEGEAVGDVLARGEYAWITVNDDIYSRKSIEEGGELVGMSNVGIGVWLPTTDAEQIEVLGGYKSRGAKVRITGIFHRACHEHGGDTDIHTADIEVIQPGHPFRHGFHWDKLLAFLVLCAVIALLWLWRVRIRRERVMEE